MCLVRIRILKYRTLGNYIKVYVRTCELMMNVFHPTAAADWLVKNEAEV